MYSVPAHGTIYAKFYLHFPINKVVIIYTMYLLAYGFYLFYYCIIDDEAFKYAQSLVGPKWPNSYNLDKTLLQNI